MTRVVVGRRWDIALTVAAVSEMLPTCWYRYGIDQAVYHYFGTGWRAGLLPYRDAFDVKPPGIYALYALVTALFGGSQAGIRVAEIACVLVVAFSAARAVRAPATQPVDGAAGLCALFLASFHTTLFGFWDTGQVELWEGACIVLSYACLRSEGTLAPRARLVGAGVLSAFAVLFKTTALLSAVAIGVLAILSPGVRTKVRRSLWFVAGFVAPQVATLVYFWVSGGLPALMDWLGYLPLYAAAPLDPAWVTALGPEMLLARCGFWFGVFGILTCFGFVRRENSSERALLGPFLILATGVVGIVVQRRYFSYHSSVLGPLLTLAAADGLTRLVSAGRAAVTAGAVLACVGAFFSSPGWTGHEDLNYRVYTLHVWWPRVTGQISARTFDGAFKGPYAYDYTADQELAALIQMRGPSPADRLHIRDFNSMAYVLTGLYSPSRFMIESPLENRYLASRRLRWLTEHQTKLFGSGRPRFFVTMVDGARDIALLRRLGYGLVGTRGKYALLERGVHQESVGAAKLTELFSNHRVEGALFGGVDFHAQFDGEHAFQLDVNGRLFPGTWRSDAADRICVSIVNAGADHGKCGALYSLDGGYIALDDDGKELATLSIDDG